MPAPYSQILCDPPWSYRDECHAGKRGAGYKYSLLTVEQIRAFNVQAIAAKDAVLFLWVTWPTIQDGLSVMEAWGFKYKTVGFLWVKMNRLWKPGQQVSTFMGMGNWTRANTEPCLIGVRGKPKRVRASVHQVIYAPVQQHSRKPAIVRDKIVQLMGDGPRLEMFARANPDGWDTFGDQCTTSIEIENRLIT